MACWTASAKWAEGPALDGQRVMPLGLSLSEGLGRDAAVSRPGEQFTTERRHIDWAESSHSFLPDEYEEARSTRRTRLALHPRCPWRGVHAAPCGRACRMPLSGQRMRWASAPTRPLELNADPSRCANHRPSPRTPKDLSATRAETVFASAPDPRLSAPMLGMPEVKKDEGCTVA